jgi:hypothetical protein
MVVTRSRNRVAPMGDIEAIPLRGAWTGNRGILHRGRQIVRFHAGDLWITCALEVKDRWHEQWQPHHYTFVYFHDEAVSSAAGHRPFAACRRDSYNRYRAAWAQASASTCRQRSRSIGSYMASGSCAEPIADVSIRYPGPICPTAPSFYSTTHPPS